MSTPFCDPGVGMANYPGRVDCLCCGAIEAEAHWITARGSDYSRAVCQYCFDAAMEGDASVWEFYWHDVVDSSTEETWRPA